MKVQDARRTCLFWVSACLTLALPACGMDVPDVGALPVVYVPPAEKVEILSLGRGQTFGQLLDGTINANEQASLLLAFQDHASPRRMRQGTEITLRYLPDEGWLRGVDVAISPDQTIRLDRDVVGWHSDLIETPIYVDTLFASGEIETVLWSAVVNNPILAGLTFEDRNRLIDHLDRVFQWQVDFSRQIRVGDTYRFAFEREVRPDGSMRAGKLLAAEFVNSGTPYHAVYFDPNGDGQGSYFDLDGLSVRRAFLLKPLAYRRISGRFTNSRYHPVLNTWRAHRGVDYAADAGTEIMATSDGVVIHRGWKGSFGNMVEIRHPNGFVTRYAHLRAFKGDIVLGTRVRQSDIIGYVGQTGLASGPHLHYEMLNGGRQMDPLSVDLPAGDPVPADDRVRWQADKVARLDLLESIPRSGPVRSFVVDAVPAQSTELRGGAHK
ncbi:MAG: M23 family metallopeptidase [Gemmatimonadetes bacterium]|nr:M23 family metallopeptidase [Gemmatimonadota bacterium]MDA1102825.1 M23 family metallopeptidase [Gemmatimonadota bacterium]